MRTVEEVKADAKGLEDGDVKEEALLAPTALTLDQIKFITSAMEDDLDPEDKRMMFAACVGKTEQEMIEIAYRATSDHQQELEGIKSVADRI